MVAAIAGDYSRRMKADAAAPIFTQVERDGPSGRRVLRSEEADDVQLIVISGFSGPALPERVSRPEIHGGSAGQRWRFTTAEGVFEFQARSVDRINCRAALYEPLHRRFSMSAAERAAVRLLLRALRLPGGARLLRWWQSRR
jgi:hypothetical protein